MGSGSSKGCLPVNLSLINVWGGIEVNWGMVFHGVIISSISSCMRAVPPVFSSI